MSAPKFPKSFLDDMQEEGRVASDSGPVTVGDVGKDSESSSRKKPEQKESQIQERLFEVAAWKEGERPELKLLYATPNGQYRPGQRMEPGLKSGVPDIMLPVARTGSDGTPYHGLYLELKRKGGRLRDEQVEWLEALREAGYAARVAYGFEEAWVTIVDYLDGYLLPYEEAS